MTSLKILVEFDYGDIVYLITDPEQLPRMVTGYTLRHDALRYELSMGEHTSWHTAIEISAEKTVLSQ